MSRWSSLLPRIIILGLILLALWISKDSLLRAIIVYNIEDHTGGKVDIGQIRCSIGNQKLYLHEVVIGDPEGSARNLVQADMAYLKFDPNELWRRRVVITSGQTSRLMFGTPRPIIAAASQPADQSPLVTAQLPKVIAPTANQLGQNWIDQLVPPAAPENSGHGQKLELANQTIHQHWQNSLSSMATTVTNLNNETANLNRIAEQERSNDNELRSKWRSNSHIQIKTVQALNSAVTQKIADMQQQLAHHIAELNQAAKLDAQSVMSTTSGATIDFNSNLISNLLLTEIHEEIVQQSVEMFQWFQLSRPSIDVDFAPRSSRGVDMNFTRDAKPGFLIKQLEVNGEARFMNQNLHYSGLAHNLSNEPWLLDAPATFELRTQGKQHAAISCKLDHSSQHPVDSITITCPSLSVGERILGHPDSLAVTMGGSNKVSANINLTTSEGHTSGTIALQFSNVALHVDHLNSIAGGKLAALRMNEAVTTIRDFESTVEIEGQQDSFTFRSSSNLGQRFAATVNRNLAAQSQTLVQRKIEALEEFKQTLIDQLKNLVHTELEKLHTIVDQNQTRIATLQQTTQQANERRGFKRR